MRFAGTRNTFRWSLDASDELGLTLCFTVPTAAATEPAPAPAATTVAPSPFRVPFLVPLPLPLPTVTGAATAGGLKSSAEVVTGVVAVDPDWLWLLVAEGTRLSGEVVHFNSMTFWGGHYSAVLLRLPSSTFVCTTINKTIFSCSTHTHTLTHSLFA